MLWMIPFIWLPSSPSRSRGSVGSGVICLFCGGLLYVFDGPWGVDSPPSPLWSSSVSDWCCLVTAFAYDVALFSRGVAVFLGAVFSRLGVPGVFALLGQFFRVWPADKHCRQVAGDPDHERSTFWSKISMIDGRVFVRFCPGIALTSISHLVVRSLLDPLMVHGAISTGMQYVFITSSIAASRVCLFLIGTFSMRIRAIGGSFPFGGRMGRVCSPTWRTPFSMNVSASLSSSKKTWMNLTSARNLTPMASSGRAVSRCLPSSSLGIFERSRK